MNREAHIQTETGRRMLNAVTPIYNDEYQLSIFDANGLVMEEVQKIANKLTVEVLINNATWSLPYWEELFRIKPADNQTIEQRRRAVTLRMNEYFPVTRRRMESIVDTFTEYGGTVINDKRGDYTFEVILRNSGAIDFISMVAAVEETKPAHLAALYLALAEEVKAIIRTKQYTFPVPYPVTGTFHTAPINGIASKATMTAESKAYANSVPYPVTGTFVARDEPCVRLEGKGEDLRLERLDLWENRNLMLDSHEVVLLPRDSGIAGDDYNYVRCYFPAQIGKTYTISFGVQPSGKDYSRLTVHPYVGGTTFSKNIEARVTHTFQAHVATINSVLLYGGLAGSTRGQGAVFKEIKIELGEEATPWQPAPEDGIPWYNPETVKLIEIDLYKSGLYLNSKFTWMEETPPGTSAIVEYSFDKLNWSKLTNGGSLPLKKYASLVGKKLYIRQVLTTDDQRISPVIRNFKYVINDKEAIE